MSNKDLYDNFRILEDNLNRMFEEMLGAPLTRRPLLSQHSGVKRPFIDIVETDTEVVATAEMPGLNKEDISIDLTEDRLEISAETKKDEEKKEQGYVYKERRSGSYYRSISLPSIVDTDKAKATYNNGVLEVRMTKTEVKKKTPLKVE